MQIADFVTKNFFSSNNSRYDDPVDIRAVRAPQPLPLDIVLLVGVQARLNRVPLAVLAQIASPWRQASYLLARGEIREAIEEPFTFDLARRTRGLEAATWWQSVSDVFPERRSPCASLRQAVWPDFQLLLPVFERLQRSFPSRPVIKPRERLHLQVLHRQMKTCRYEAFEQEFEKFRKNEGAQGRFFSFFYTQPRMLDCF